MKQTLEHENSDLANDLKAVQMAKQESERKRRQLEQNVQELNVKLTEVERMKGDSSDRATKLQVKFGISSLFSQAHDVLLCYLVLTEAEK